MQRSARSNAKRGFTLIELLVVIAIIAILAAILFPVFARARENARRTSCLSNLKQMGLAVMQYTQDYDEMYPLWLAPYTAGSPIPPGGLWNSVTVYWPQLIYPYHNSLQLFRCPSGVNTPYPSYGNYGANRFLLATTTPVSIASVAGTANTYLLMDAGTLSIDESYADHPGAQGNYLPGAGTLGIAQNAGIISTPYDLRPDFQSGRHFDGVNVCFADGHAKWLKSDTVLAEAKKVNGPVGSGLFYAGAWNPANS